VTAKWRSLIWQHVSCSQIPNAQDHIRKSQSTHRCHESSCTLPNILHLSLTIQIIALALLSLHAGFYLAQLTLTRQQLLSLLVDLSLYLDLDLA
jgi:hypothetical protein